MAALITHLVLNPEKAKIIELRFFFNLYYVTLTRFWSLLPFHDPWKHQKRKVFWRFQEVPNAIIGQKWVKNIMRLFSPYRPSWYFF